MTTQLQNRYLRQLHCFRRDAVVIKLIRLDRLRDLQRIPSIEKEDVKVIHLLRDPRAVFNSRMRSAVSFYTDLLPFRGESHQKRALDEYEECNQVCDGIDFAEKTHWLRGKYMAVNYDHMMRNPQWWAEEIYKFVGLRLPDIVREWISGKGVDEEYYSKMQDCLKTRKNASLYHSWEGLTFYKVDKAKSTETQCSRAIRKFKKNFAFDPDRELRSYYEA